MLLTKGVISISTVSSKEKLFCTYYCISRNAGEAAAKAGYIFPEKSALRLLRKKEVQAEIEKNDREKRASQKDIISGYYRLAFGCYADAVSLLFKEEITDEQLRQMDLYNISDIKRKKGGDIEIRFFDRLKALEHLQQLACEEEADSAATLFSAIEKGAAALRDEKNE
ncbi:MAG: terminase small subunit [Ruminococcaceae bacterium]|nr:terminase small subunit [Oscillospiraceae bacterium]MBQ9912980.1 terminase small subunit [Clostridia bacterium]